MTDYKLGDAFYLPSSCDEICTLEEIHTDGTMLFASGNGYKTYGELREAFPATIENYEKLSQLWPHLEKPPVPARDDVDVTGLVRFSDEEYKTHQPTSLPSICWVKNEPDRYSAIEVITVVDDDFGYFYNSRNEGWDYAIPLTKGELEQLTKLNGEAK